VRYVQYFGIKLWCVMKSQVAGVFANFRSNPTILPVRRKLKITAGTGGSVRNQTPVEKANEQVQRL
jgi:hypothetical protein